MALFETWGDIMFVHIVNWLNANQGFAMSVLTLVYIVATLLIFIANYLSVKELKRTRIEQSRPHIIVYLDVFQSNIVQLTIQNIGKTVAKDIEIACDPDLDKPKERPLKNSYFFTKKIPNMPPDYKYLAFVGTFNELKNQDGEYKKYRFTVKYKDSFRKNTYCEEFISDLNVTAMILKIKEFKLHDLVQVIEKYGEKLLQ